jgi:hypothetical protein
MATVYLSPTGSDSYTYTQAQNPATPWQTFAKVNSSATSGDTVICAAGEFILTATLTWSKSFYIYGAALDPTTRRPTTIVKHTTPIDGQLFINLTGLTHTWSRVLFTGVGPANPTSAQYSVLRTDASGATLILEDCWFDEVLLGTASGNQVVVGKRYTTGSLYLSLRRCVFNNCRGMNGVPSTGLITANLYDSTDIVEIINCVISQTSTTYPPVRFINNMNNTGKIRVVNSIFYNNTGSSIPLFYSTTYGIEYYRNSVAYNMTNVPTGTGNLTSDPKFVDAVNKKFWLAPDSPCLGAGTVV